MKLFSSKFDQLTISLFVSVKNTRVLCLIFFFFLFSGFYIQLKMKFSFVSGKLWLFFVCVILSDSLMKGNPVCFQVKQYKRVLFYSPRKKENFIFIFMSFVLSWSNYDVSTLMWKRRLCSSTLSSRASSSFSPSVNSCLLSLVFFFEYFDFCAVKLNCSNLVKIWKSTWSLIPYSLFCQSSYFRICFMFTSPFVNFV